MIKTYTKQDIREIIFATKDEILADAKKDNDPFTHNEQAALNNLAWKVIDKLTYEIPKDSINN